jgi:hypothetical protein
MDNEDGTILRSVQETGLPRMKPIASELDAEPNAPGGGEDAAPPTTTAVPQATQPAVEATVAASRDTPGREARAVAFLRAHEERLARAAAAAGLGADHMPDELPPPSPPQPHSAPSSPPVPLVTAAEELVAGPALRAQIVALTEMGFSSGQAVRALKLAQGDLERAAELILGGQV